MGRNRPGPSSCPEHLLLGTLGSDTPSGAFSPKPAKANISNLLDIGNGQTSLLWEAFFVS